MLQRGGLGLPRVAAVVLLPGALLPIHVGPAFASWRCTYAAHLGKFNVLIPPLLLKSGQIQSAKAAKKPMDINETLTRTGIGIVQVEVYMWRGNVRKVTVRSKRTGVNAIRVKSWSMYSNIISSRAAAPLRL